MTTPKTRRTIMMMMIEMMKTKVRNVFKSHLPYSAMVYNCSLSLLSGTFFLFDGMTSYPRFFLICGMTSYSIFFLLDGMTPCSLFFLFDGMTSCSLLFLFDGDLSFCGVFVLMLMMVPYSTSPFFDDFVTSCPRCPNLLSSVIDACGFCSLIVSNVS